MSPSGTAAASATRSPRRRSRPASQRITGVDPSFTPFRDRVRSTPIHSDKEPRWPRTAPPILPVPPKPPPGTGGTLIATCLGFALLGLGCAPPAFAETGRLVQVDIVDRDGGASRAACLPRPLAGPSSPAGPARAATRGAGRQPQRRARDGRRVAIDGVNIMTGETPPRSTRTATCSSPYQSASLTGWRKSHSEGGRVRVHEPRQARTRRARARPDDVGVIGVAIFRERRPVVGVTRDRAGAAPFARADQPERRASPMPPSPAPSPAPLPVPVPDAAIASADAPAVAKAEPRAQAEASAAPNGDVVAGSNLRRAPPEPVERLGTGHGDRETSVVVDTTFDRLTPQPQELVRIRYDSLPNLVAAGIAPRTVAQVPPWSPRAFPGSEPGFVPDPPTR